MAVKLVFPSSERRVMALKNTIHPGIGEVERKLGIISAEAIDAIQLVGTEHVSRTFDVITPSEFGRKKSHLTYNSYEFATSELVYVPTGRLVLLESYQSYAIYVKVVHPEHGPGWLFLEEDFDTMNQLTMIPVADSENEVGCGD